MIDGSAIKMNVAEQKKTTGKIFRRPDKSIFNGAKNRGRNSAIRGCQLKNIFNDMVHILQLSDFLTNISYKIKFHNLLIFNQKVILTHFI